MTKKERTIKAFKELAHKYRNPFGNRFREFDQCKLCVIHCRTKSFFYFDCAGCPLAANYICDLGCMEFRSYKKAIDLYAEDHGYSEYSDGDKPYSKKEAPEEFLHIANLIEKYLPVIEKWPASRFTKKGWKYSGDEISRGD